MCDLYIDLSCENAGECVEIEGDLIDIESDSDGGDTEGTCTDMEDEAGIEAAVIENLGKHAFDIHIIRSFIELIKMLKPQTVSKKTC